MTCLAFLRHGQSTWNLANRFTGWVDVPLTEDGVAEARTAGQLLRKSGVGFTAAYTSVLSRAVRTLNLALEEMEALYMPVEKDWRLNERHYGGLTGLNKAETAERHGAAQVRIWRRSYDVPPPLLEDNSAFPSLSDARYAPQTPLPMGESLKMTLERVVPYWEAVIAPRVAAGENLVVAAHGNSLRALVKILFNVSDEDIVKVEIPTGNPLLLEVEHGSLEVRQGRYLDAARATVLPAIDGGRPPTDVA